jgi:nickel-dependent lactate racemase
VTRENWKGIGLEYGKDTLELKVPPYCEVLQKKEVAPLQNPAKAIEDALSSPIGSPRIDEIVASSGKDPSQIVVAITVSDNTRPVPYSSEKEEGILLPLLRGLEKAGVRDENIIIVVGTGTHLPTSREWKREAFGEPVTGRYRIVDHDSTSLSLVPVGNVEGVEVKVNRQFMQADIRIATSLVEPHFMAGASGGRKTICPGIINLEATYVFHGVDFMDNPSATNMVLDGNPCHEFALKVARRVGVDFSVNVTVTGEGKLTGVFAGDLERAHSEAVEKIKQSWVIPCRQEYDIILTQGGKVAVNHYQATKAAYGVIPIIREEGMVILVAHNTDTEPVGKDEYKRVMKVLREKGPGRFTEFIRSEDWQFVPDQWQVQKWDQFFHKSGSFYNLIYCTTNIPPQILQELPGRSGYHFVETENAPPDKMVQKAIVHTVEKMRQKSGRDPTMAFVREGSYAVPLITV